MKTETQTQYYRTYASVKKGSDLYIVPGNSLRDEDLKFIGNFNTMADAEKKAGEMGLEKLPMYLQNQMDN